MGFGEYTKLIRRIYGGYMMGIPIGDRYNALTMWPAARLRRV